MTDGSKGGRPTKNERRDAAREKARVLREQQKKRDRRNRVFLQGGIAAAVLAVLAIVAVVIVVSIRPPTPGPANMASEGVVLTKGMKAVSTGSMQPGAKPAVSEVDRSGDTVDIVTYVDYLCPYCGQFEKTNAAQIEKLVDAGAATLEVHPIAILTSQSSGTKYSLRAANAAACVVNSSPNAFWDFHTALFDNQPEENTAGLTDAQLKSYVKSSGAGNTDAIDRCIDSGKYENWVQTATERAQNGPIANSSVKKLTGTPLVLVNGKQYTGSLTDTSAFRQFVLQAQGETYSSATPTPTPMGTSTPTGTPTSTPAG